MTETTALAKRMETVREWLEVQRPELEKVLMPQGMDSTRYLRMVVTACLRQPRLLECSRPSLVLAVMECAALGLEMDSVSGLAYLVPFKDKGDTIATLIVGYRGMIQLAYRHPKVVDVAAVPIFEQDEYSYEEGIRPVLRHRPKPGVKTWDTLIGCYARARIVGGGYPFKLMFRDEIEEHRARSRSWTGRNQELSPWTTDAIAMALKTPVRTLAKFIPQSPQLMRAIAAESDPETERPMGEPPVPHGTGVDGVLDAIAGGATETAP